MTPPLRSSPTPPVVVLRKVKRPEGMGRWPAYAMGEDRHGLWLYGPKGPIYRGQVGSRVSECEVGQGSRQAGQHVLHLIPSAWWLAEWCREPQAMICVDICTPPARVDGEWRYVDLELDPVARADGSVEVVDEDEFAAACAAGLIPPVEEAAARAAAAQVEGQLQGRQEPFGRAGWGRLDQAVRLRLPPIRDLRPVAR